MGTQSNVSRRASALCLVVVCVPALAAGRQSDQGKAIAPAFANIGRPSVEPSAPARTTDDYQLVTVQRLFSARQFGLQRRISVADDGPEFGPSEAHARSRQGDATNWVFARPIDGFTNGFDQFGNPSVGPVDIRGEARNYVRQKIVSEILSRTALGRGLGVLIDTGKAGPTEGRSRLLPFLSPKVNAREGKAALTLTWKF